MTALKEAMINKNQRYLFALRAIKAAILIEKTSTTATSSELTPIQESAILQKLIKQRKDALAIFSEQNRDDLAQKEQQEIDIITTFLPKQMDYEEVKTKIQEIIHATGAQSIKEMGKIMKIATKELNGASDNKTISEIIKSILS